MKFEYVLRRTTDNRYRGAGGVMVGHPRNAEKWQTRCTAEKAAAFYGPNFIVEEIQVLQFGGLV